MTGGVVAFVEEEPQKGDEKLGHRRNGGLRTLTRAVLGISWRFFWVTYKKKTKKKTPHHLAHTPFK